MLNKISFALSILSTLFFVSIYLPSAFAQEEMPDMGSSTSSDTKGKKTKKKKEKEAPAKKMSFGGGAEAGLGMYAGQFYSGVTQSEVYSGLDSFFFGRMTLNRKTTMSIPIDLGVRYFSMGHGYEVENGGTFDIAIDTIAVGARSGVLNQLSPKHALYALAELDYKVSDSYKITSSESAYAYSESGAMTSHMRFGVTAGYDFLASKAFRLGTSASGWYGSLTQKLDSRAVSYIGASIMLTSSILL